MQVAKRLVLFLRRSGNQAQFSGAPQRQNGEPPRLRNISEFILEHLAEPLPVQRLARALAMSSRSLSRLCSEQFGESPAALVRRLRIEEARRLLEETALPLKEITVRTGIGDESTFWRLFTRRLGVTPAAYRERFSIGAGH
jgi:transcriptional regulator GlxA family with amidase domain